MPAPVTLVQRSASPVALSRLRARGLSDLLAKVYANRGVSDVTDVRATLSDLLPADSMKNVREMANYLADCKVLGKRVLIVADYDCDGATACSTLVMAFACAQMEFGYLVPDRVVHGYGLSPAIVDEAAALDPKPDVIITVDNGISSHAGIDRANELGIDVLVTDHHHAPDVLPNARLIVNPNQPGCDFASKNIAGCGVAWYVARAFLEELARRGYDTGFDAAELLSYVALGTVADVVKLDKNNRILVREGLKLIRKGICAPGVRMLARVANKDYKKLTCSDIGFGLGPRINAAGRLAHMGAGIECLTKGDDAEALELAITLDEHNVERKDIQSEISDQAVIQATMLMNADSAADSADAFGRRSIVVFHADWHEGVVGIVAGKLKEERHRPTVVMTYDKEGNIKGSGRSIEGFHLKHVLDAIHIKHPGTLLKFGGHAMAAGMTIARDKLETFRVALEEACRAGLTPAMMTKTLKHDGALDPKNFTIQTIEELSQEVWGQGFEEPVFLNTFKVNKIDTLKDTHLKLSGTLEGVETDVMAFFQADLSECIPEAVTIAHKPNVNSWHGTAKLQTIVELMPESLNPSIAPALRDREAIAKEAAAGSVGTSHDPARQGANGSGAPAAAAVATSSPTAMTNEAPTESDPAASGLLPAPEPVAPAASSAPAANDSPAAKSPHRQRRMALSPR